MQDACHQNQVPESDFPKLFVAFLKRFRAKATDTWRRVNMLRGHMLKNKNKADRKEILKTDKMDMFGWILLRYIWCPLSTW